MSAWNDPGDPTIWSGTVNNLLRELAGLGVLADPGYRDVTPWVPVVLAVRYWQERTGRRSAAWAIRREMRVLLQLSALASRARAGEGIDGSLFPVGAIGRPVRQPYVTWCDIAPAQIAAAHPGHSASLGYPEVTERDLAAVLRQQVTVYRKAHACLTVSSWAARSLVRDHGVPASRVHVVGAGRNVSVSPPPDRDWSTPRYLFVANSWERKNGAGVLRAFCQLRAKLNTAELHLVGQHPAVSEAGVTAHGRLSLTVAAERARLEELFRRSTCFVMPSQIEPFGIVYVEAAAAGLPSIASTVGGTANSVGDGGILVDADDEAALSGAMLTLADPATAQKLGQAALARAGAFTWRACAERVVRAFAPDLADQAGLAPFL